VQIQVGVAELDIVKPPPEPVLLEPGEIVDVVVLEALGLLDTLDAEAKRQEQAVETLDT
jgi:hypothetical protein